MPLEVGDGGSPHLLTQNQSSKEEMSYRRRKVPRRKRAIALRYAKNDNAPVVVASGAGEIAKKILNLAAEHNVPVKEDDTLVDILSRLDVGYQIPPETYRAVAEILAFLYRTDYAWQKLSTSKVTSENIANKSETE